MDCRLSRIMRSERNRIYIFVCSGSSDRKYIYAIPLNNVIDIPKLKIENISIGHFSFSKTSYLFSKSMLIYLVFSLHQ